jgi:hypothetical protein
VRTVRVRRAGCGCGAVRVGVRAVRGGSYTCGIPQSSEELVAPAPSCRLRSPGRSGPRFRWPAGSGSGGHRPVPVAWRSAGSRFPVPGSRFPVPGSRFPVPGSRFPVPGSRFPVPGSRNRFSWFRYPFWILFLAVLRWVTRSGLLVLPLLFAGWSWFRWPAGSRCLAVGWFQFRWPAGSGGRPIAVPVAGHHPAQRSATPGWAAPLSSSLPRTGSSAREMTGVLRPQRAGRVPHLREEMRR